MVHGCMHGEACMGSYASTRNRLCCMCVCIILYELIQTPKWDLLYTGGLIISLDFHSNSKIEPVYELHIKCSKVF